MQKTIIVPPSSTPTTVTVDIADPIIQVTQQGGTPIVEVPPVVVEPPATDTGIPATAKILLQTDFSKGLQTAEPSQIGKGAIVDRNGEKVFRAYVPRESARISSGYRSELRYTSIQDSGRKMYYGEITVDKVPPNGETQVWQWHPDNATGSSTLRLNITGNKFTITRDITGKGNIYEKFTRAIIPGQKYRLLWDINWSSRSDGFAKLYIDGQLAWSVTGPTMQPNTGVYGKAGINTWDSAGGAPDGDAVVFIHKLIFAQP